LACHQSEGDARHGCGGGGSESAEEGTSWGAVAGTGLERRLASGARGDYFYLETIRRESLRSACHGTASCDWPTMRNADRDPHRPIEQTNTPTAGSASLEPVNRPALYGPCCGPLLPVLIAAVATFLSHFQFGPCSLRGQNCKS
jgi:hypothetical protein